MSIKIQFSNSNTGATAQGLRVYRSATTFTNETLPSVHATLPPVATEYVDADVTLGEQYHYMFELWRTDAGIDESLFSSLITVLATVDTGAGPTVHVTGDNWYGYYGEVTAANFIAGDVLANAAGLSSGTSINSGTAWMKFSHRNRTLFVPKMPIRHSVSYDDLVSGDLVDGAVTVTIGGKQYRVRLLQGACINPATSGSAIDPLQAQGSEWNELLYPSFSGSTPSQLVDNWASNNNAALGALACWTRETVGADQAVTRGDGSTIARFAPADADTAGAAIGWRPVLELVV